MNAKYALAILTVVLLGACRPSSQFKVNGDVAGAAGKTLYLEASTLEGIIAVDSTKLNEHGTFSFKQPRPESPEFYRLRIDNNTINFSVDSTETVTIHAPYDGFSINYDVEGSESSKKIKELTLKQAKLQREVEALYSRMQANKINMTSYEDSIALLLKNYKDDVKMNYIYAAPDKAYAYFALFQKVGNYLIFDPLNSKEDVKCFGAVATNLNNRYPHAMRSKNLYNIVIKGMRNTRPPREKVLDVPEDKMGEAGVIDIRLRDLNGKLHSLTDYKGKVVLLDFTIYQSAVSTSHNYSLRDLYDKYADKGLVIYQISLDADEHFWKTTADNLPWVCVRDPNGIYSSLINTYNIQSVPSYYIIDKKNELRARSEQVSDLDAAIKSLL